MTLIPCQNCGKDKPKSVSWYICDKCAFRICMHCISKHKGKYGTGFKCSQCRFGHMKKKKL